MEVRLENEEVQCGSECGGDYIACLKAWRCLVYCIYSNNS